MPSQQYYLLLADRDSTTGVLKERKNIVEITKVHRWNENAFSWNLTRHTSSISKIVSHRVLYRAELPNPKRIPQVAKEAK